MECLDMEAEMARDGAPTEGGEAEEDAAKEDCGLDCGLACGRDCGIACGWECGGASGPIRSERLPGRSLVGSLVRWRAERVAGWPQVARVRERRSFEVADSSGIVPTF